MKVNATLTNVVNLLDIVSTESVGVLTVRPATEDQGWSIHKEPLINKVTATKTEELQEL